MTRIKVDFNKLVRNGQVRASLRHADGELRQGDIVEAFDPSEDMSYEATVTEVDEANGRVYLQPHWEPAGPTQVWAGWTFQWTNSVREAHSATTYVYGEPQIKVTPEPVRAPTLTIH